MIADLVGRLEAQAAPRPPRAWRFDWREREIELTEESGLSLPLPRSAHERWSRPEEAANCEAELLRRLDPLAIETPASPTEAVGDGELSVQASLRSRLLADGAAWPARLLSWNGGEIALASIRWLLVARLLETTWTLSIRAVAQGDWEARWGQALLARARFLVLSEPFRDLGEPELAEKAEVAFGGWEALARRAQQAREVWADDLLAYEDRPALTSWDSGMLEEELRALAFRCWPAERRRALLDLRPSGAEAGQTTAWQRAFALRVERECFLPRFMLGDAWHTVDGIGALRLERGTSRPRVLALVPLRRVVLLLPLVMLLAGPLALGVLALVGVVAAATALEWGALVAALIYAVVVAAILGIGPEAADLVCLRLPAGAAIGLLALLSFGSHWASRAPPWTVPAVAGGAALGYLVVEARNHGAPRGWVAARRAAGVTALGLAHALAVTAIMLRWVAPTLVQDWSLPNDDGGALARVVLTATSTALAVGVFAQVLWEDTPVTSPLSHLQWRGTR